MPNTQTHTEKIKCPDCGTIQDATVEHTIPFHTYLHNCEKCNFTIMESDWEVVPNTEKQLTACQMLREKIQELIIKEESKWAYDKDYVKAHRETLFLIDLETLTNERQNIINAVDGFPLHSRNLSGEEYFEQTFKPNK